MRIRVTKPFNSKILGSCNTGDEVECEDKLGWSIVASKLADDVTVTTEDVPIRRTKRIKGKRIETAAVDIETASE